MKTSIKLLMTMFLVLGLFFSASASTLTYELNSVFSGTYSPAGTPPWLIATFTDTTPNNVSLTLTAPGLATGEFVSEWDFNVNPVPSNSITIGSPTITGNIVVNSATFSANSLKADGDGYFDLGFTFSTSGQNSGTERFTVGESITFLLTGNGLDAMDFLSMSSADSGVQNENGLLYTGAHVQGITVPGVSETQSAWITTPVPAAAWLLGSGLLGLVAIRRRVKK